MSENQVCGVDPSNFKGKCIPGESKNKELCNWTGKSCVKKSRKTWAQIEAELKKGLVSPNEIVIPVEAVQVVADSSKICGVDPANFKSKCIQGESKNQELCNWTGKSCVKKSRKTWAQIEADLKKGLVSPKQVEKVEVPVEAVEVVAQEIVVSEPPKVKRLTPFFAFMAQMRDKVKAENPNKPAKEIASLLAEMWRNLTPDEQAAFKENAPEIAPKIIAGPKSCGFDISKKNCVRGVESNQQYCQEGEKGQCKKSTEYNKYTLDDIAKLIQGIEVAPKLAPTPMECGFDLDKKNCVRSANPQNTQYCQAGLKGSCKKAAEYDKISLEDIAKMIRGEPIISPSAGKYCKLTTNKRTCEDAEEMENDANNCYYNSKTKKCTKRKVGLNE